MEETANAKHCNLVTYTFPVVADFNPQQMSIGICNPDLLFRICNPQQMCMGICNPNLLFRIANPDILLRRMKKSPVDFSIAEGGEQPIRRSRFFY